MRCEASSKRFRYFIFFCQGYRSANALRISFRLQMFIHLFVLHNTAKNSHTSNESISVFQPGKVMRKWYRRIHFLRYRTVFRFNAIKVNRNDAQSVKWQKWIQCSAYGMCVQFHVRERMIRQDDLIICLYAVPIVMAGGYRPLIQ